MLPWLGRCSGFKLCKENNATHCKSPPVHFLKMDEKINLTDEDKVKLLKALNRKGFVLENRLCKVLKNFEFATYRERNIPFDYKGQIEDIDATANLGEHKKIVFE